MKVTKVFNVIITAFLVITFTVSIISCKEALVVGKQIEALEDKNSDVRGRAAEALGKIGDSRAVEPLIKALKDKNKWVQGVVQKALKKIQAKKS